MGMPGLLKTLNSNKHQSPPIRIFEIGDVIVQEPTRETGSKNIRRVCAMNAANTAQFSMMHGVLDQLLYTLNCEPAHLHSAKSKRKTYTLKPSEDPAFFPGRQAHVVVDDIVIGIVGELHPDCVSSGKGYDVNLPVSCLEVNLEPFLEWL